jgi:hypothetical protein
VAEEKTEHRQAETAKRGRPLRWWAGMAMLAAAAVLALLWISGRLTSHSAEEQLAAIEAARAIPDEENAARFYSELLAAYDEAEFSSYLMRNQTYYVTQHQPWRATDYPELARWLQTQRDTIAELLEASKVKDCRFPIFISPQQMETQMERFKAMRLWAYLLACAANNDIAEGRIEDGLEKYLCIIQMAEHLYQQPSMIDFLFGFGVECLAMENIDCFVVEHDIAESHLIPIEVVLSHTTNDWNRDYPPIRETERLYEIQERKQLPFLQRFIFHSVLEDNRKAAFTKFNSLYLETLARRRGARILVALKRYKNEFSRWPESLDEVKSLAPPQVFVDPLNGGSLTYKLTGDSFILYSNGTNSIDDGGENGRYAYGTPGTDDIPIWPSPNRTLTKRKIHYQQSGTPDG